MFLPEQKTSRETWFASDEQFDKLYPSAIQLLAQRHWTPLYIAKKTANFLSTEDNCSILDVGSGVGKFCLAAAFNKPKTIFYGIEQRDKLNGDAEVAKEILKLKNVFFINGNFTQIDFKDYDHFYFFNSFYEKVAETGRIDDTIEYSGELFNYYNRYLHDQLNKKPAGTKLVTYHSLEDEVPKGYRTVFSQMDGLLKYWIKI